MPRFARPVAAVLGKPPRTLPGPAASDAGAPPIPAPGNDEAAGVIAEAQNCGTERVPIEAAFPQLAVTAPLLIPTNPNGAVSPTRAAAAGVVAEATALASPDGAAASTRTPLVNPRLAAGGMRTSPPPTARICSGPSSVCSNDSAEDADDSWSEILDVDAAGDASCCSAAGTADVSCDSVVCVLPAEVPAACVAAAAWPVSPLGLVVEVGGVNGVIVVAVAEALAYPYIAATSSAHICM